MLMPVLTDAQYVALGKFAYQFCNLERWVNWGIIEGEDIADLPTQDRLPNNPFERRLNRLEASLNRCQKHGLITPGRNFTPEFDFARARELGSLRNALFHGEPHTFIDFTENTHVPMNIDASHHRHVAIDDPTLGSMAREAQNLAARLMTIVCNLALAKQSKGQKPRTMQTSSL